MTGLTPDYDHAFYVVNYKAYNATTEMIEPKIHTGTFPLGNPIDVALFQGQVITIRID